MNNLTIGDGAMDIPQSNVIDNTTREFLRLKGNELTAYQAKVAQEAHCKETYLNLVCKQNEVEAYVTSVKEQCAFAKSAQFGPSIYDGCKKHEAGVFAMHVIAGAFAGYYVIAQNADSIIECAGKDLAEAGSKLEIFTRENRAMLVALDLIPKGLSSASAKPPILKK